MSTRVAILGANGQVGSQLVRDLADQPDINVVAICRNAVGAVQVAPSRCETRLGTMNTPAAAAKLLGDCDVIINCIWPAGPAREVQRENEGVGRALAGLEGSRKVVFLSSVAVHGYCIDASRSSFERPLPDSPYGRQKVAFERFALDAFKTHTARCYILRLGHVYGPHQWLSQEILALLETRRFALPFDGARSSNAIHVTEVASALKQIALSSIPQGIYNLTSQPQRSWRDLFDWHAGVCNLSAAGVLDPAASEVLRARFVRMSRRSEMTACLLIVAQWIRNLPFAALLNDNSIRGFLSPYVSILPTPVQVRLKAAATVMAVRGKLQEPADTFPAARPWHCSDAMPGPYLDVPFSEAATPRINRELAAWYHARSTVPQFAR